MASFWNIFKRLRAPQYSILIDVGTYSIRSLLVEKEPSGLVGLKKQTHIFTKRERTERLAEAIRTRLHEIIFRYIKSIGKVPGQAVIGLASRITYNTVIRAMHTRKNPNRDFSLEEREAAIAAICETRREVKQNGETFICKNVELVRVTLDGYDIPPALWNETPGKEFELSLALTYVRNDLVRELEKLRNLIGGIPIRIIPAHAAVVSVLTEKNPDATFLLLKIGGAITEISAIEHGVLLWTEPISFGGENFTNAIARTLTTTSRRAEEIKRQYETASLSGRMKRIVSAAIAGEIVDMQKHIHTVLVERNWLLPEVVFLYGGGSWFPEIGTAFRADGWFSELTYHERLAITRLEAEHFAKSVFVNNVLRGPEDVDLASLAISITNKEFIKNR